MVFKSVITLILHI